MNLKYSAAALALWVGATHSGFELKENGEPDTQLQRVEPMAPSNGPLMRSPQGTYDLPQSQIDASGAKPSNRQAFYRVEGYLRRQYVFGEVALLPNGRVEGFVMLNSNRKLLIQGEQRPKGVIEAQSTSGEIVQLQLVDPIETGEE